MTPSYLATSTLSQLTRNAVCNTFEFATSLVLYFFCEKKDRVDMNRDAGFATTTTPYSLRASRGSNLLCCKKKGKEVHGVSEKRKRNKKKGFSIVSRQYISQKESSRSFEVLITKNQNPDTYTNSSPKHTQRTTGLKSRAKNEKEGEKSRTSLHLPALTA